MKKLRKFLFLAILLTVSSCSNKNDNSDNEPKRVEVENKEEKEKVTRELDETVGKSRKITEFNVVFTKKDDLKRDLVFSKNEEYDFSIYTLGGSFDVEIEGEKTPLKDALQNGKITVEDILNKMSTDVARNFAKEFSFKDGGSVLVVYSEFSIVKFNTLDGNFDMYFTEKLESIDNLIKIIKENEENQR